MVMGYAYCCIVGKKFNLTKVVIVYVHKPNPNLLKSHRKLLLK
jgi:hypothetical protein